MVRSTLYRTAFTMIELIFAIVIIAISIMSLPMVTQVVSSGIEKNLIQEAIFAASAQLSEATTYTWDERSTNDLNISTLSKVVNTNTGGCTSSNNRPGNINRECLSDSTIRPSDAASANGSSINDIAYSTPKSIFEGTNSALDGYKADYNSILSVSRCTAGNCTQLNSAEASNENLKQIEYRIVDTTDSSTLVLLRVYSANIGEIEPSGDFL